MGFGTESYRHQHNEVLRITEEISALLDDKVLSYDAAVVRTLLSKLSGTLIVHLELEDYHLYPKLLEFSDDTIAMTAKKSQKLIGVFKNNFLSYIQRWQDQSSIQKNPVEFIAQSKEVITDIKSRIKFENNDLFVLLEKHGNS